ncbi:DUF695 domain-containing protein [Gordonia sp. TBRC 11910]|uniref:DUF695 domain-containing protein n=1 Tax=Gordonia asplenii TaxID=2725283 RepID=A0A848KYT9_9ACTN|nr:DUF695 domain-containing protein [Gordonia asplenii]NMO03860.1 DUF695 domain-containing protein [Gordonia asplenii]
MADPETEFWVWWTQRGQAASQTALATGDFDDLLPELTARIERIDRDLAWEFGPGDDAEHRLTVTGGGRPRPRAAAQRWFDCAPESSAFEFAPAKSADPSAFGHELAIDGIAVSLSQSRFRIFVDEEHWLIQVGVYHPAFRRLDGEHVNSVTFLMLDWLLGEDGVERWVAGVESLTDNPTDGVDAASVVEIVNSLAARAPVNEWVLLSAQTPDGPLVVNVRRPFSWLDDPLATQAVVAVRDYPAREDGLPGDGVFEQLVSAEDALQAQVPDDAFVASVTGMAQRRLHLFLRPDADLSAIEAWARACGAQLDIFDDPGWTCVRDFR